MNKINPVVLTETRYILKWSLVMSVLMQAVFLVMQKWDYTVLLGNLLSIIAGTGNFFLMGITVQKAVKKPEDQARSFIRVSQTYRMFILIAFVAVGVVAPIFNMWAVVIGLLFPRIAILIRPVVNRFSGQ